ncbi:MAG: putative Hydroxymethylglutaryl-CoA reductase [Deltaproteobacteria bacterium]|nr:putative Hydroxymethylglutaryl-CoA reductase [Deltaproteobacteria bacterium]
MMTWQLEIPESRLKEPHLGCSEDPSIEIPCDHLQDVHDHGRDWGETRTRTLHPEPGTETLPRPIPRGVDLAALYLACGQDTACVAESATGVSRFEVAEEGDLYASVTLPNLMVGTVGGGTGLPSQKACLDILGLSGPGKAAAFAEVAAGLCLAGELSIAAAVCAGEFTQAHERLARQRADSCPAR